MAVPSPAREKADRRRSSPPRSLGRQEEQDAASDSSSSAVSSAEAPERRDIDILAQVLSTRSEEYRLLFRLPHGEVLVQDFNCALQENILLQGHLYLFIHHICFYSNIFGFETKRIISYHEVTCVRKAKTAAIFPTAIEIMTGERKHFFGSFLSRDEAYKIIVEGWQQHSSDARFLDNQESRCEGTSPENAAMISERENGIPLQADCSNFVGSVVINNSEVHENGEMNGSTSEEGCSWQPEDADAPKVPDYFIMVAEGKFLVQVEEFFKLFFSDAAADFLEKFHQSCGDKALQCGRWQRNAEFVHARDLSFQHPIKIYFGAKFGHCHAIQKFRIYRNSHLVLEVSQQVSDVPYGDYFHVQVLWNVEKDVKGENGCLLQVYINVAFSRKTMWKGKIEQNTIDECREVYGKWISNAHELLKEKNLEEFEGVYECITNISHGHDAELESPPELEHPSNKLVTRPHAATQEVSPRQQNFSSHAKSPEFASPVIAFLKGSWTNLSSYARSQNYSSPLLIAIILIILISLQLSIIILLTRTPEVQVISQDYYTNGITRDRSEVIDWLERRLYLLNEEMNLMEARMERMRREYSYLKGHLQDLQRSKHQR